MTSYLNICAVAKNEALYVDDWVRYHAALGVGTIVVYDNESTDGTKQVLRAHHTVHCRTIKGQAIQLAAYNMYMQNYKTDAIWTAFIDIDEFIVPLQTDYIINILRKLDPIEHVSGLGIQWKLFGSSGEKEYKRLPVVRRFCYRQRDFNPHIKCIIRNSHFLKAVSPHWFETQNRIVNENGVALNGPLTDPDVWSASEIQINHYVTKSENECRVKLLQKRADNGQMRDFKTYFEAHDRNEIGDARAIALYNRYVGY